MHPAAIALAQLCLYSLQCWSKLIQSVLVERIKLQVAWAKRHWSEWVVAWYSVTECDNVTVYQMVECNRAYKWLSPLTPARCFAVVTIKRRTHTPLQPEQMLLDHKWKGYKFWINFDTSPKPHYSTHSCHYTSNLFAFILGHWRSKIDQSPWRRHRKWPKKPRGYAPTKGNQEKTDRIIDIIDIMDVMDI